MAKYEKVDQDDIITLRTEESSSIKHLKIPTYMLEASGITRLQLDSVILLFALFNCFFVTFYLSFGCERMFDGPMKACGICTDLAFIANVYLSLTTTYNDKDTGDEVVSLSKIILHRLPGLVLCDLPAGIPMFFIDQPCSYLNTGVVLVRLIKLFSIFSFVNRLMYLKLGKFTRLFIKFFEIILWLSIYIHLMACLWNFIVGLNDEWQPFALIEPGSDFFHLELPKRYALCVYTIVASISRFEMLPSHRVEYIFLACSVILGTLFTSILYGSIIVILQNLGKNSQKFMEEHEKISKSLKNLQIPKPLKKEIKFYFRNSFNLVDQEQSYQKLLTILPPSIKKKLNSNIFGGLFSKNKLFENKPKLINYLIRQLDHRFVQPEELIIKQFELDQDLFFLNTGRCQVEILDHLKECHSVKSLVPGSLFGEVAIIFNTNRSASVRATEYSTIAQLSSEKLSSLFSKFPSFKTALMTGLSLYKDPYRMFVEKTLSKLKYLHGLDSASFSTLVYSLPIYSCPTDSELFSVGQVCNSAFLVLEGSLKVMFEVQGPSISQKLKRKSAKLSVKDLARVRAANLVIEELGQGSVIGSNLLILEQKFVVTGRCTAQTRVMVFSRSHLDELMLKFPSVKLAVEETVAKLKLWDPITSEEVLKRIPLDYHKCLKYTKASQMKSKTCKLRTLFKSAVIEKILAFREWKQMKKPGMKVVLKRLKALIFLEGKGKNELEFLISNGKIQPEVAYASDLIGSQELHPLVAQFAVMAKETGKISGIFQEKIKELRYEFEGIRGNSEACLGSVAKLMKIYADVEKYLKR